MEALKTEFQKQKEAREEALHKEYSELMSVPGSMSGAVIQFMMKKHGIHSASTIWSINKRVENRLNPNASTNA